MFTLAESEYIKWHHISEQITDKMHLSVAICSLIVSAHYEDIV